MEVRAPSVEKKRTTALKTPVNGHSEGIFRREEDARWFYPRIIRWRLYVQLLPGISFVFRKMKHISHAHLNSKMSPDKMFQQHLFFGVLPGVFFDLILLKEYYRGLLPD